MLLVARLALGDLGVGAPGAKPTPTDDQEARRAKISNDQLAAGGAIALPDPLLSRHWCVHLSRNRTRQPWLGKRQCLSVMRKGGDGGGEEQDGTQNQARRTRMWSSEWQKCHMDSELGSLWRSKRRVDAVQRMRAKAKNSETKQWQRK